MSAKTNFQHGSLTTVPTKVQDKDGKEADAHLAVCGNCGMDIFNLFIVNGHNHIYCPTCNTTYCQGGC